MTVHLRAVSSRYVQAWVAVTLVSVSTSNLAAQAISEAAVSSLPSVGCELCLDPPTVRRIVMSGGEARLLGSFDQLGTLTGRGVPVDAQTGDPIPAIPEVDGTVLAAVPDGNGGWWIGGAFSAIGGVSRPRLARVRADGSVDPAFDAAMGGGSVSVIVPTGNQLYIGGGFSTVGGQVQSQLAAVDAVTGALVQGFAPVLPLPSPFSLNFVSEISVANGAVYFGGSFLSVEGTSRGGLAAVDAATGALLPWNPSPVQPGAIFAVLADGPVVYVGGNFTSMGGVPRTGIAAVDATTGVVTAWNPGSSGYPKAFLLDGSTLYVAGGFQSIGGVARRGLAALDVATGAVLPWDPAISGGHSEVESLQAGPGTLYLAGSFTAVSGQPRSGVAEVSRASGTPTPFAPHPAAGALIASPSGGSVYVGGSFSTFDPATRVGLAAVDPETGTLSAWNPGSVPTGHLRDMAVSGNVVFVAGSFQSFNGLPRRYIVALDRTTGAVTPWLPAPIQSASSGTEQGVRDIEVVGQTLYISGSFHTVGGQPRSDCAALDVATGQVLPWDPDADSAVLDFAHGNGVLYVAGEFRSIGGQPRDGVAALDLVTGAATPWNPNALGVGQTHLPNTLAVAGSSVFVGGRFTMIGGQPRSGLAEIDAVSGLPTPWAPSVSLEAIGPGFAVIEAILPIGPVVCVGGTFGTVNGVSRMGVFAVERSSGILTDWNPVIGSASPTLPLGPTVYTLARAGSRLLVGGSMVSVNGSLREGLAAFDIEGAMALSTNLGGTCGTAPWTASLITSPPVLGEVLDVFVHGAPGVPGLLFVAFGPGPGTPIGSGCTSLLDPYSLLEVGAFTTDAFGGWTLRVPLAGSIDVWGAQLWGRAILASAGSFALTNGVELTFGF